MRIFACIVACALSLAGIATAQEASPTPSATPDLPPLLQIYEARVKNAEMNQLSYDDKHPLLTIREIVAIHLAHDDKGILLVLKDDDAKALADITREYDGRPLMFKAVDGTVRPITINGPVENGRIGFKYPEAEPLAADYRRHFHLGEFGQAGPPK